MCSSGMQFKIPSIIPTQTRVSVPFPVCLAPPGEAAGQIPGTPHLPAVKFKFLFVNVNLL